MSIMFYKCYYRHNSLALYNILEDRIQFLEIFPWFPLQQSAIKSYIHLTITAVKMIFRHKPNRINPITLPRL